MKAILVTLMMLASVAHAGDRNSAYNAICKPMPFDTDRANCMNVVKHFSYFDDRGLAFCANLSFDSDKLSCMQVIGDKMYEAYEMDNCLNLTFDTQKIQCLKDNGTRYNPGQGTCVPREEVIKQLNNSLYDLRNGNVSNADQRISNLLGRFTRCN